MPNEGISQLVGWRTPRVRFCSGKRAGIVNPPQGVGHQTEQRGIYAPSEKPDIFIEKNVGFLILDKSRIRNPTYKIPKIKNEAIFVGARGLMPEADSPPLSGAQGSLTYALPL